MSREHYRDSELISSSSLSMSWLVVIGLVFRKLFFWNQYGALFLAVNSILGKNIFD